MTWSATYKTFLGSVVGVSNWPISGIATASIPVTTPFLNVEILLDNSGSMEIGASPTDIKNLEYLTACSVSGAYYYYCSPNGSCGWVQSNGLPAGDKYHTA